jgi:hypothetical protein
MGCSFAGKGARRCFVFQVCTPKLSDQIVTKIGLKIEYSTVLIRMSSRTVEMPCARNILVADVSAFNQILAKSSCHCPRFGDANSISH